jgi:hypothetical protein
MKASSYSEKLVFFALIFVSVSLCMYSEAYSWMKSADFAQGQNGQPAHGPSGFDQAGPNTTFSNDLGVRSAKFYWPAGSYGELDGMTYPSTLREGGQIWYKASMYFKSPWSWKSNPVVKIMRLHVANRGFISIFAEANGSIDYSNEVADKQQYGGGHHFDLDKWQDLEIYVKFSTTSPITRIWKNGVLIYQNTTDITLGSPSDYSDFMYTMSYWNGSAPQNQTQYVRNVVITTDTPPHRDANGNPMLSQPPGTKHTPRSR